MYVRILATGTSSRQNHKMKAKRGFERFLKRSRFTGGRPNRPPTQSIVDYKKKYVKVYIHYALLMMSQKESPRNHPWVLPKRVVNLV